MAIKGGNPLFKLAVAPSELGGFDVGVNVAGMDPIIYQIGSEHPLFSDFAYFGILTKVRNHIGAVKEEERTPELAYARAQSLFEAFENGEWDPGRDGEAAPSGGVVARAMAEVLKKDVALIVGHIRKQFEAIENEKERAKALRKAWDNLGRDDKFAPTVKRIKEEDAAKREALRAAQKVDTKANEGLIAGLLADANAA